MTTCILPSAGSMDHEQTLGLSASTCPGNTQRAVQMSINNEFQASIYSGIAPSQFSQPW